MYWNYRFRVANGLRCRRSPSFVAPSVAALRMRFSFGMRHPFLRTLRGYVVDAIPFPPRRDFLLGCERHSSELVTIDRAQRAWVHVVSQDSFDDRIRVSALISNMILFHTIFMLQLFQSEN